MSDNINHPSHYTWLPSGVEPIDIEEWLPFNRGAVVKYVIRAGHKGGPQDEITDLKKARWMLDREIARMEKLLNE